MVLCDAVPERRSLARWVVSSPEWVAIRDVKSIDNVSQGDLVHANAVASAPEPLYGGPCISRTRKGARSMGASPMRAQAWRAEEEKQRDPGPLWPRRHGIDPVASRALTTRLRKAIDRDPEPDDAQWATLGHGLTVGDPLGDDVADWLLDVGMAAGWPLVDQCLSTGEVDVALAPASLVRLLRAVRLDPPWLDPALLARGARFMQGTGGHGLMVLRDAGLMAGYQASAINQTLMATGALHRGTGQRVAETGLWWLSVTADGGLEAGAPGFAATVKVRLMHALVRRRLEVAGQWDDAYLGRPINQTDLQITYLAFSAVQMLGLRMLGANIKPAESLAVMHLWRYVGWLMGVHERFLCENEMQARVALFQNLLAQAPPDQSSQVLAKALMAEPFERDAHAPSAWRRKMERACHLSVARWFVGAQGMHALGLPAAWPWYPLLVFLPMRAWTGWVSRVPGLRGWARRRARARQEAHVGRLAVAHLSGRGAPHGAGGCPRL